MLFSRRTSPPSVRYDASVDLYADQSFESVTGYALRQRDQVARNLADRVNEIWSRDGRLPRSIAEVAQSLPAHWASEIQEACLLDGADVSMLIAWIIVEIARVSDVEPFDRAAFREARRIAQNLPERTASTLRRLLGT